MTLVYKGISMWQSEWARELGIHPETLRGRIKSNMPEDRIFNKGRLGKK